MSPRFFALVGLVLSPSCLGVWSQDRDAWDAKYLDAYEDPGCDNGVAATHYGVDMVTICPGTRAQGSPEDEEGRDGDETQHQVSLSRASWIGVYEITQDQFEDRMGYMPAYFELSDDNPVENVTWHQAADYANAMSDRAGRDRCYECSGSGDSVECGLEAEFETPYDCLGYRLPTEAEWERAARAGSDAAFGNGGNLQGGDEDDCGGDVELDNGELLDDSAWYCGNAGGAPIRVGRRDPNAWGLYDMHGNVFEWVHDRFEDYDGDQVDPFGSGSGTIRVIRGGSWAYEPRLLRSANRDNMDASWSNSGLGFRLAQTVE